MANVLRRERQLAVLNALVEGNSVRSVERIVCTSRETVLALLVRVGTGCERLLDRKMRELSCERIECDEIWSFIARKRSRRPRDRGQDDDHGRRGARSANCRAPEAPDPGAASRLENSCNHKHFPPRSIAVDAWKTMRKYSSAASLDVLRASMSCSAPRPARNTAGLVLCTSCTSTSSGTMGRSIRAIRTGVTIRSSA